MLLQSPDIMPAKSQIVPKVSHARAIFLFDGRKILIHQVEHLGVQVFKFTGEQASFGPGGAWWIVASDELRYRISAGICLLRSSDSKPYPALAWPVCVMMNSPEQPRSFFTWLSPAEWVKKPTSRL